METLKDVRAFVKKRRKELSEDQQRDLSEKAQNRFIEAMDEWDGLGEKRLNVVLYRPMPGEVDLRLVERYFDRKGSQLAYPKITHWDEKTMKMLRVPDFSEIHWEKTQFELEEPPESELVLDPTEIDLIFVPGLAFGPKGERVGSGAGFYDRYLVNVKNALRVALAFDFQVVESLEQNPWDQPVDWVVTEERVLRKNWRT